MLQCRRGPLVRRVFVDIYIYIFALDFAKLTLCMSVLHSNALTADALTAEVLTAAWSSCSPPADGPNSPAPTETSMMVSAAESEPDQHTSNAQPSPRAARSTPRHQHAF